MGHLRAVRPRQAPLLRKQESIQTTHSETIPFIPSEFTTTQRKVNQEVFINEVIERKQKY
jgi:hypothetical protein